MNMLLLISFMNVNTIILRLFYLYPPRKLPVVTEHNSAHSLQISRRFVVGTRYAWLPRKRVHDLKRGKLI